jgi:hypothetical protein
VANYNFPLRSYDIYFSEEHLTVLKQCAKKVAKRFDNRVEVGDLITEGWLLYARHQPTLDRCHNFVYKAMCKWARAWLNHTLESLDGPVESLDKNVVIPTTELKTSEDAEFDEVQLQKYLQIMLSKKYRDIVNEYLKCGSCSKTGETFGLTRERIRQIIKKLAA